MYFGYRPIRYGQADLGLEGTGGIAGDRRLQPPYNDQREYTYLMFLVPFGVRGVGPLFGERLLLSAGGGASLVANVEYKSGGDTEICVPGSSRSGVGGYGGAQVRGVLGESRRFGLGVTARWTKVKLGAGFLPNYGPAGPADQWVMTGLGLIMRI